MSMGGFRGKNRTPLELNIKGMNKFKCIGSVLHRVIRHSEWAKLLRNAFAAYSRISLRFCLWSWLVVAGGCYASCVIISIACIESKASKSSSSVVTPESFASSSGIVHSVKCSSAIN
jgi:hypothetical protein